MARTATGRLAGRTALVTGASQGLGRAVALACAFEGADLLLVARRAGPLERVRTEVEALGARAVAVTADVGDPVEDPDALRRVLEVNLLGPFLLTRALLGPMLAAGDGSVINVSSDAGVVGFPGWGAYGVSKAALDQMTRIWASELEETGVRVNSVDPGDMATAMHAAALPDDDPAELARPEDRTEVFVYLASPESAGVTGQRFEAAAFAAPGPEPARAQ